ncbi:unnamed protein product [Caenorhabditis auriculariae]|uniref:G-protein coupled receptors family 1 profile domain-containing protein n=1 Tax=Caenorhabditis auriculariae TaxID=2777116 RepID=A0A8S1HCA3_9PELO|nr:unnamed protein product [Caenorhabditis auriculariae]
MLQQLSSLMTATMSTACIFGIITNLLSLVIFTRPTFRKRSINMLLAALSASDLAVCLLGVPVYASAQTQNFIPVYAAATIMVYAYPVTIMFQSISVWLLVSIAVDRYLAVCHPFMVNVYCTRRRAKATIFLIVMFSVAYNFVRFWEFRLKSDGGAVSVENIVVPLLREDPVFMLWYQNLATLLTQFLLPLVVLCVLNLQVARTLLLASEQRRELVASERREHSTAKMMMMVVVVFLFCYSFSFVLNVAEIYWKHMFQSEFGFFLNDVNNVLVIINSCSAFIFYYKFSTRFRKQAAALYGIKSLMKTASFRGVRGEQRESRSSSPRLENSTVLDVRKFESSPPKLSTSLVRLQSRWYGGRQKDRTHV